MGQWEDDLIDGLPMLGDSVYTPYTCKLFLNAGQFTQTDVEHMVARAEALDSGLLASRDREFAADTINLTIADRP